MEHKGKRLFITGIPTAGKSYLAKKLAEKTGGIAVFLDTLRDTLVMDEKYKKWVNFYYDRDEEKYWKETSAEDQWRNLVAQSECFWPAFLHRIDTYADEKRPVIFESVNILPHLARKDLKFSGVVLIGSSLEETLKRNIDAPRWGKTLELQKLEAEAFFRVERPKYKSEAKKFGYPIFESADVAFETSLKLLG